MKTKNIFLTLALALCTTFSFAQKLSGLAANNKHNMAAATWNTGTDEICITCHTPHNAKVVTGAPLWNHASTQETAFGLYASTTLDATMAQPTGTSKLCLSCHDGTVDLAAWGVTADTGAGTALTGTALLGTNLATHHPVSFGYQASITAGDAGLHPAADALAAGLLVGDVEASATVECASCHDAHDNTNGSFLRMSNAGSALCLTCHNK